MEFVTILLLFYVLFFGATGMWDLSFPTRNQTCTPCIGRQSLNQYTTREVPVFTNFKQVPLLPHQQPYAPHVRTGGNGKTEKTRRKKKQEATHMSGLKASDVKCYFHSFTIFKSRFSTWVSSGARWTPISFLARDGYTRKAWCPLRSCHANGPWRPSISHWPFPAREAGQAWCSPVSFGSCEEKWQVSVMPLYLML